MSAVQTQESEPARRHWWLRLLLVPGLLAALFLGAAWYRNHAVATAEKSALEYVRLKGFTSEGDGDNLMSSVLSLLLPVRLNMRPIGAQPTVFVGFPRDRMNDYMVQELLNIRNLVGINLFPPDPQGSGIDFKATSVSAAQSLRNLDLALSKESIQAIEDRFPKLVIRLMDRAGAKAQNDETK